MRTRSRNCPNGARPASGRSAPASAAKRSAGATASIRAASNARWRVKKNDEEPTHAIAMSES
ncbi:hypothetical protein GOD83_33170, partial [Sinorhizobium medicae]|nr:hypothetical protein [Sinorhizobium medicae]MDX0519269.1 hypothetical protein [Sinorhizobium medicae]MDX0568610.1 hypothetical protein [Sinorhizobium medicae]MDX0581261.1 hypothetical protein [Sinorhizobium medicae]MDX0735875.1 hypothetical protein [Sinorhizobium medicae]